MKTVQVRITAEQAAQLDECFGPTSSRDKLAQRAVDLLLEIEGPVFRAANEEARKKLAPKRQDVRKSAKRDTA